jgi:glycosyltransferase involved in cell wall biosynthesis
MERPLVSVVMSVYNNEKYVADAIRSILQQNYENFEFVILNDGSTDKSRAVILEFAQSDNRIILVDRFVNKGLPYSLNEMIAISKGKYIARMDADDVSAIDRLKKQVELLEMRTDIDILGGQIALIDGNGTVLNTSKKPLSFADIKLSAEYVCPVNHPTYMVKREVYAALCGYRELFIYAQDYDFILRAIDSGFVIENMTDELLFYRSFPHMHSTVKRQRQLFLGRYALILHRQRVRTGIESAKTLEELKIESFSSNMLFSLSWNLRNRVIRSNFIRDRSPKFVSVVLVFFFSLLHREVFDASLRGFLNSRSRK